MRTKVTNCQMIVSFEADIHISLATNIQKTDAKSTVDCDMVDMTESGQSVYTSKFVRLSIAF